MAMPAGLAANIEAYERTREQLEKEHLGKYVAFSRCEARRRLRQRGPGNHRYAHRSGSRRT